MPVRDLTPTTQESSATEERLKTQSDLVAAVLAVLGPILDRVALTKETIQELKKPYEDPKEIARIKRQRIEMAKDIARGLCEAKAAQDRCPHAHDNKTAISLVNNHPDGRVRGLCNMCNKMIHPAHYEIASTGKPFVVPADKEYD